MDIASRWLIVEERPCPSTDYFVLPYLRKKGVEIQRLSFSDLPQADELMGVEIIFVRYIPRKWRALVQKNLSRLSSVHLFIDDDLFDWHAFAGMSLRYQLKILRYSWSRQHWLKSVRARLLVSTSYLHHKYQQWSPELLQAEPMDMNGDPPLTIFYHGSASHIDEIRWLVPIIQKLLQHNSNLSFEIIGDTRVNRLFREVPRVQVLHPMKWLTYVSMICKPGRHIGLAPLLNEPFNLARSYTKFFDITQSGAVGIYTKGTVFETVVRHEQNGLLLPMKPEAWVEAILRLADDQSLRQRMLEEARQCL